MILGRSLECFALRQDGHVCRQVTLTSQDNAESTDGQYHGFSPVVQREGRKTFKLWEEREREQDKDRDNSLNSIAVFARDRLARQILASVILG